MQKTIPTQEPIPPTTKMDDVVSKVEHRLSDVSQFYAHIIANTTENYYQQMIDDIVFDLTVIPVECEVLGVELTDDVHSVNTGIHTIAAILSSLFEKSQRSVEADLMKKMHSYPADDLRQSRRLSYANSLN